MSFPCVALEKSITHTTHSSTHPTPNIILISVLTFRHLSYIRNGSLSRRAIQRAARSHVSFRLQTTLQATCTRPRRPVGGGWMDVAAGWLVRSWLRGWPAVCVLASIDACSIGDVWPRAASGPKHAAPKRILPPISRHMISGRRR